MPVVPLTSPSPHHRFSGRRRLLAVLCCGVGLAGRPVLAQPAGGPGAAAAAAEPAAAASGAASNGKPTFQVVPYKQVAGQTLVLNVVRPSPETFAGPRPALVFFHGGSWRGGSPNQFRNFCVAMAEIGVVGISAQYRLMRGAPGLPFDAVRDARSALRHVKAQAAALGIDPQRVGAAGGSSGGHLAVMTALGRGLDDPKDDRRVSAAPALLFLMNPMLDLDGQEGLGSSAARWRELSPLHQLGTQPLPPTLIFQGTADRVVPHAQAEVFRARALALGARDVRLELFEDRPHGFFNANRGERRDFDSTLAGMKAMLQRLGWVAA
jgi:acetyl esterase